MAIHDIKLPSTPIIKKRNFNPQPVAGKIPNFANGKLNPDKIGTKLYDEWWEEQFYYILNGYNTGGIWIPPKYYHLLNFVTLKGVKGSGDQYHYPEFIDSHYILWLLEEQIRKDFTIAGGIFPKKRRFGLTYFGMQLFNYGIRFIDGYQGAVGAGLDAYIDRARKKFYNFYNNTIDELKINVLQQSESHFRAGYIEKTDLGNMTNEHGMLIFQTLKDDHSKLEGEFYNDYISEETGQFSLAKRAYDSVYPALTDGELVIGKSWIYGTAGEMKKAGKVFQELWNNAESRDFVRMFLDGTKFHRPYFVTDRNKYKVPNLKKEYPNKTETELLGCEDKEAARAAIKKNVKIKAKNPDKTDLYDYLKFNPLEIKDVFTSTGTNNFNNEILLDSIYRIGSNPQKWKLYKLEFEKTKNGEYKQPLKVNSELIQFENRHKLRKSDLDKCVIVLKTPNYKYNNLDYGGIDGYNEDKTKTTSSLGAMVITRRKDNRLNVTDDQSAHLPIALYYRRPARKELFYEMTLKMSVWYDLKKRVNVSAESDLVISFYKNYGGKRYLAKRPRSFDSPDSKMIHEFGTKMTSYSKPRMLGVIQTQIDLGGHQWEFEEMCSDALAYDEEEIGTDWDSIDAYGLSVICIIDNLKKSIRRKDEDEESGQNDIKEWKLNNEGDLVSSAGKEYESEMEKLFGKKGMLR